MEINTIYNEDCLATMCRMPDKFVDLVVTSPPYDNIRKYHRYSFDFEKVAQELFRIIKVGGVVVWVVGDQTSNASESGTSFRQALYFKEVGFKLYDTMIYRKSNKQPLNHPRYEQEFEYMFIFSRGRPKTIKLIQEPCKLSGKINGGTCRNHGLDILSKKHGHGKPYKEYKTKGNIWSYAVGVERDNKGRHPAVFPEKLAEDHILSWSNEQDLIYDPFLGSGTTAKMAKKNNRNYIGSEISKEYCELALERIDGN